MSEDKMEKSASVVGLGLMGTVLAQLLIKQNFDVTVWNRTPNKADKLVADGADFAPSVAEAVKKNRLVVVCVHDYKAVEEILDTAEVRATLGGKIIVNLTTGRPQEAQKIEEFINRNGGEYLDGAILAVPKQMGEAETMLLFSGKHSVYRQIEQTLGIFGGNIKYLGEKIGAASAMDLGVLSYMYGAILGFFHAIRMGEVEGIRAADLGQIIEESSKTIGEFLKYEAEVIQKDEFTVSESQIKISIEAVAKILKTAQESGINTEFPAFTANIFQRAKDSGYEHEELGALIKVFRENGKAKESAR